MALSNTSRLVSFDGDEVRRTLETTVAGTLRSVVEYTADEFNPLYVDDVTLAFYEDEDDMLAHFERIHSYVHLDFTEMDLFTNELFPIENEVRFIATGMTDFTLLRAYVDSEGVFAALDRDEPIAPLVAAIEESIRGEL